MLQLGLNLNSLVVFAGVYRNGSMTLAARELGMTQPGVSQHIQNLEGIFKFQLFHRTGKKLISTKEADLLFEELNSSLQSIEDAIAVISSQDKQFKGTIKLGLPIEFGNNMILPHLPEIRKQLPQVQFHITYGLPHELNGLLLEGKLDFAFIDQIQMNPAIKTEVVFHENLILCCSKEYFENNKQHKREKIFFESLSYVAYQKDEPIIRNWFERAYGFKKMKLSVASYSFDVQGVSTLVAHSMGVGVLPEHVVLKLKDQGINLHQFRSKNGPVNNPISLAYLEQKWNIPLNQFVISKLKELIVSR